MIGEAIEALLLVAVTSPEITTERIISPNSVIDENDKRSKS